MSSLSINLTIIVRTYIYHTLSIFTKWVCTFARLYILCTYLHIYIQNVYIGMDSKQELSTYAVIAFYRPSYVYVDTLRDISPWQFDSCYAIKSLSNNKTQLKQSHWHRSFVLRCIPAYTYILVYVDSIWQLRAMCIIYVGMYHTYMDWLLWQHLL